MNTQVSMKMVLLDDNIWEKSYKIVPTPRDNATQNAEEEYRQTNAEPNTETKFAYVLDMTLLFDKGGDVVATARVGCAGVGIASVG
ncbi:hypothetical protein LTR17_020904 [Elasticomyces elasticus]|nr:hypothetical protein LTR17_020904 [Elasticomyces elasticus]